MKTIQPIKLHLPNILTLINLVLGTLATMEGWHGRYMLAARYVLVCIILDFFDGYVAKKLKAFSAMGEQLDVLADLVSFGIAPGAIAAGLLKIGFTNYQWPYFLLPLSYGLPLLIPVVSGIRLAKFNVEQHHGSHFKGMPVPANASSYAALALIHANPRFEIASSILLHPLFIIALIVTNSFLMLAPLPMFSLKLGKYSLGANIWRYLFVVAGIGLAIWLQALGLFAVFVFYIFTSIGMSIKLRHREK
ncbi:CDP-diacylglycerol--serine O-phosphatidyltransferase [Olavius algarvensis spirochete endosymbiont]|uniref:CDP-alcohol phosphatidyltransferase family protein n=1 Tax=Olavius algarvensis spirochete endosymbiont TaxID=260710 RepID=UPI000F27BDDF|nr:CDP-alcohol phosphatidyltransferase family protein [Olavius algarvensis spirochete endosymbiont]VDB00130.1 CDP-diacylglycerol--serine O-phosphatidyltransferase [Olavius algarvensis spirochete endosymbiont]